MDWRHEKWKNNIVVRGLGLFQIFSPGGQDCRREGIGAKTSKLPTRKCLNELKPQKYTILRAR